MILLSYRLSLLVLIDSLVRRVGELGARSQFRDDKVAVIVKDVVSKSSRYRIKYVRTTLGRIRRTY